MGWPFCFLLHSRPAALSPSSGAGTQPGFPVPPSHCVHQLSPCLPVCPVRLHQSVFCTIPSQDGAQDPMKLSELLIE